ncbi:hypothetical protein ZIOFF_008075 [Zingiber officinale]|uniref:UBX domain-containing protein n=1 Tax=Zingiber officinale TaxID=94328 RepID=A0A8J5LQJ8_ZINOF|nr:hypothetical protein ZIOFF_008075 [Zingiber officinale]
MVVVEFNLNLEEDGLRGVAGQVVKLKIHSVVTEGISVGSNDDAGDGGKVGLGAEGCDDEWLFAAQGEELERKLAAKASSLPQEPPSDDVNAVTLLVRMPDGSRRGRRFLKSDKLQFLYDYIDIGKVVKPGSYRLFSLLCFLELFNVILHMPRHPMGHFELCNAILHMPIILWAHKYLFVRPYPRRAFTDGDGGLSLSELGLTSKQEALFLELI